MAMTRTRSKLKQTPRLKIWLEIDGQYSFGHGLCRMLQAVDETGSIKLAAKKLGKSYRYVWGRIKQAEAVHGTELVDSMVGGRDQRRSCLTPVARKLVEDFTAIRQRMIQVLDEEFQMRLGGE